MLTTISLVLGLVPLGPEASPLVWRAEVPAPISGIQTYDPGTARLHFRSTRRLPDHPRDGFIEIFRYSTGFFGAFAFGKDGSFGYALEANTPASAASIAIAQCETFTTGCILYAEIWPDGYVAPDEGILTLSAQSAGAVARLAEMPEFKAIAVSVDGAWAAVWGHLSQQAADADALADCEGYRLTGLAGMPDMPCRLIPGSVAR